MNKLIVIGLLFIAVCGVTYVALQKETEPLADEVSVETPSYTDATFIIEGVPVTLSDGYAETDTAPGSVTKVVTRYFGNELSTDLNGDGTEDVAFVLTQETGGSGVFYYAVAVLATEEGYRGSDGYLLGDRISPQSTELSPNPRHQQVIVFNYADRLLDEPMSAVPSVGKSAYLKLNEETMQWGVVEPDFEGESI